MHPIDGQVEALVPFWIQCLADDGGSFFRVAQRDDKVLQGRPIVSYGAAHGEAPHLAGSKGVLPDRSCRSCPLLPNFEPGERSAMPLLRTACSKTGTG